MFQTQRAGPRWELSGRGEQGSDPTWLLIGHGEASVLHSARGGKPLEVFKQEIWLHL